MIQLSYKFYYRDFTDINPNSKQIEKLINKIFESSNYKYDIIITTGNKKLEELDNYVKQLKSNQNIVLVTHYVLISEVLNYAPSSGEIVVSDKNFNIIGSIEINY